MNPTTPTRSRNPLESAEARETLKRATFCIRLGKSGFGTGFFISPNGMALSAYHNFKGSPAAKSFEAMYQERPIELWWRKDLSSEKADIAVLELRRVPSDLSITPLTGAYLDGAIADHSRSRFFAFRTVFAYGYPLHEKNCVEWFIEGMVDGTNPIRNSEEPAGSGNWVKRLIVLCGDAARDLPGISGAAILDQQLHRVLAVQGASLGWTDVRGTELYQLVSEHPSLGQYFEKLDESPPLPPAPPGPPAAPSRRRAVVGVVAAALLAMVVGLWWAFRPGDWQVELTGARLKRVAKGDFVMGSSASEPGRSTDEGPPTNVELRYRFWIGEHEVTQGEFELVTGGNPSFFNGSRYHQSLGRQRHYGSDPARPVETVTWSAAAKFCADLTAREHHRLPSGYEYRLPTEAEWEYACRAGTMTRFSFGNDASLLSKYAWFGSNSADQPHPVGTKLPNRWGIYDMHGNVMEWCHDYYQDRLPGGKVVNPTGPVETTNRVLRGGSWKTAEQPNLRSADRWGTDPGEKGNAYGFRIVLAPTIQALQARK